MHEIILRDIERSSVEETLIKGERLIDHRVGIIQDIYEHMIDPDDPPLFYFTAKLADTSRYSRLKCSEYNGGASLLREQAKAAAIGESVERYCAGIYNEDEFIYSSYNDVKCDAIDPREFTLFSENQYSTKDFKFSRFSKDVRLNWVWGYSLVKKQPILVPASFVYVPYLFRSKEELITQPTSTGLAAANNMEEAILSGIYEVVERDAYMIMWLNQLSMSGINLSMVKNEKIKDVIERFVQCGISLYINNITTDLGIPTIGAMAVLESGRGPAAAVGAATRLAPELAVLKSLEETAHTRFWIKGMMRERPDYKSKDDFSDITDLSHHPFLYGHLEMLPRLKFLMNHPSVEKLEGIPNMATGSILKDIQKCVEMIAKRGFDVIVVDITTPDIKEVGFSVVRVLIPGGQPLDVEFKYRFLGGKRLYEVPKLLGYPGKSEGELYGYPHPFP
jgi:ribosomal protein S12 methylthiotransferase accessory factor